MGYLRLAAALCLVPAAAHADPITALFTALATAGSLGAVVTAITTFAGTALGGLILNAGLAYLLRPRAPSAPKIADAQINTRLPKPMFWILAGPAMAGGEVGAFAEHDEDGNLWVLTVHGEGETAADPDWYLDGIPVTISDGTGGFTAGDVLTDAFCLTPKGEQYEGSGTKVAVFRLYSVSPSSSAAYGALPAAFTAAFPDLPADFRLIGMAFTILRCAAQKPQHYTTAMHWRGALGLGEPTVGAVADWSRVYDPRDPGQDVDDDTTWLPSGGNPVLLWAWWRTHPHGLARPLTEVNWTRVAEQADLCDDTVLDSFSDPIPRYRGGFAFRDDLARKEAEAEILKTCDGIVVYDDDGKAWVRIGYYEAPTLSFTAERDILVAETVAVNDGEAALDGVVVTYLSPEHAYAPMPAAPWLNPLWNDPAREPNLLAVEVLGCQNHNQAVRLAKAFGMRAAPDRMARLGCNARGLLAKSERAVNVAWDDEFDGEFEVVGAVEEDESGRFTAFGIVPLASDRWDLNPGEEGDPPPPTPALNIDTTLEEAASVVLTAEQVAVTGGFAVRLAVTFAAPSRPDRSFRFRYALASAPTVYEYFTVDMEGLSGHSAIVENGEGYEVSWQTYTAAGRATVWTDPPDDITATADPTAPAALTASGVTPGTGQATVTWTGANDAHQYAVRVYRNTTTTFGSATLIATVLSGPNAAGQYINTGLAAGTYYFWAEPVNGSGVAGTAGGSHTAVVT